MKYFSYFNEFSLFCDVAAVNEMWLFPEVPLQTCS